jgi:hypothetical protein
LFTFNKRPHGTKISYAVDFHVLFVEQLQGMVAISFDCLQLEVASWANTVLHFSAFAQCV